MDQAEFIQLVEDTIDVRSGTVSLEDRLSDIDWDSLADIIFIAAIDEKFGITLDAERLAASTTPRDLLALVNETCAVG